MKIHRAIPPTAAPISWGDYLSGLYGIFFGKRLKKRLEKEIREYFGVNYLFLVSSGKAALTLILMALKTLSNKKEVIIPAYTCFSVPSAIIKAGLRVKLCDIDPSTLDFDYNLLEKALNERTLCVIPNHLFGISSDLDRINGLCRNRGIYVIEDAAQAMDGVYKEKKLGTIGDAGFFSLGRGKNITCGSGGMIITNSGPIASSIEKYYSGLESPGLFETIKGFIELLFMKIFIHPLFYWFPQGLPFLKLGETFFYKDFPIKKLSGVQMGWLRNWKRRLNQINKIRRENGSYFVKCLRAVTPKGDGFSYLRLPVIVENKEKRNRIYSRSRERGLGLSLMYPTSIDEINEIKENFQNEQFPAAREISEKLLALPTHSLLSEKDKKEICELVNSDSN